MMVAAAEYHCTYSATIEEARKKGRYILSKYGKYLRGRVVDLGCGDGALLLALQETGSKELVGVENNAQLADLAESWGVRVVRKDLLKYLHEEKLEPATYVYTDIVEHLPFEVNLEVMRRLPESSRLVVQTPHTQTLRGHEFYFNVPSHVAAYSPEVLKKMLRGNQYEVVAEGSVDNAHPNNWQKKVRGYL